MNSEDSRDRLAQVMRAVKNSVKAVKADHLTIVEINCQNSNHCPDFHSETSVLAFPYRSY
jgi:hypothetical protein